MILPRVNLPNRSANARTVLTDDDEEILGDEPELFVFPHNFDVSEALPIRTNFVLTLHDQHTVIAQDAKRFLPGVLV